MVVFFLFRRDGVINREDMENSLRDGSKACQSNERRGIGERPDGRVLQRLVPCRFLQGLSAYPPLLYSLGGQEGGGMGQVAERFSEGAGTLREFAEEESGN